MSKESKISYKEDWPKARERWEAFWQGEMLDRVVLPKLIYFASWGERCWYHVDGAGALRHLPAILDIPKLRFVQLSPVSGPYQTEGLDWVQALKKIKSTGKAVQMVVSYNRVGEAI